jgi:hypothetical protein
MTNRVSIHIPQLPVVSHYEFGGNGLERAPIDCGNGLRAGLHRIVAHLNLDYDLHRSTPFTMAAVDSSDTPHFDPSPIVVWFAALEAAGHSTTRRIANPSLYH